MNYTKNSIIKKRENLNSQGKKYPKFIVIFIMKMLVLAVIAVGIIGLCVGLGIFKGVLASAPEIDNIDVSPTGFSTFVYDTEGNQIAKLVSESSNRIPVAMSQIPQNLAHAFVAIEDERFYQHNGIDIQGIIRAFAVGIKSKNFSEGASTITQQLLKNNVFTDWVHEDSFSDKMKRKIQEWFLAIELEKVMDKDPILENYMNTVNLGQNTLGVQAASQRYFGKPVGELALSECAVIAAITQNPTKYNPITHPEANAERRLRVLNDMKKQNYISERQYQEAVDDDVYSRIQNFNETVDTTSTQSYFVDALTTQVLDDLENIAGLTPTQADYLLFSGGLKIYSTQDPYIQGICDEIFDNEENYPQRIRWLMRYELTTSDSAGELHNYSTEQLQSFLAEYHRNYSRYDLLLYGEKDDEKALEDIEAFKAAKVGANEEVEAEKITFTPQPQTSMTILENGSGFVRAMVGGRGTKEGARTLNRATKPVTRSPGSTFKPLAAYAPALDSAGLTLATVFNDAPFNYSNPTRPVNNWYPGYRGLSSLRLGIQESMNIIAVKTITYASPQVAYDYLLRFGFTTLVDGLERADGRTDIQQASALGGLTNGVTNMELTAAYSTIANAGAYIKPTLYSRVVRQDGTVLLDNTQPIPTQVIKDTTAYLLTSALVDAVAKGTGGKANFSGMSIAGKTGTATDNRDLWFAGFTPYYTASVWTGFDNNAEMKTQQELDLSKLMWKKVMSRLHENLEDIGFDRPAGIVTQTVCSLSGKLPIAGLCDATLKSEIFDRDNVVADTCDVHYQGMICAYSGLPAAETCPFKILGAATMIPPEPEVLASGNPMGTAINQTVCPHDALFFADPNAQAIIAQQQAEIDLRNAAAQIFNPPTP